MTERYAYFIAAGRSLEAVGRVLTNFTDAANRMTALCERLGASHPIHRRGTVTGFAFAGKEAPAGWKDVGGIQIEGRNERVWAPRRTGKANKALYEEMKAASYDGFGELNKVLGLHQFGVMVNDASGFSTRSASAESIGGKCVIGIPLVDGKLPADPPADAIPLKMSEYYALKEAAEGQAA